MEEKNKAPDLAESGACLGDYNEVYGFPKGEIFVGEDGKLHIRKADS